MFAFVRFVAVAALYMVVSSQSQAALLPPYFVSSVIALGSVQTVVVEPGKPPVTKWVTEGTGFFFGYLVQPDADPLKRRYAVFLVTAGHVVKLHPQNEKNTIGIRVDATEASAKSQDFDIPIADWFFHPNGEIDLAAVSVPLDTLKSKGLETAFFASDEMALTKGQMADVGVAAGDGVFILGFPMVVGRDTQLRHRSTGSGGKGVSVFGKWFELIPSRLVRVSRQQRRTGDFETRVILRPRN
jgi:hypothetical protein